MSSSARARAAKRAAWPGIKRTLDTMEPSERVGETPRARIAAVWRLTLDAWALSGRALPSYRRSEAPGRVIRPATDD